MTTRHPKPKTYTVGNPNGIAKDVQILEYADPTDEEGRPVKDDDGKVVTHPYRGQWFEGDEFTPPPTMTAEMIARRVEQGFLIPKEV